MSSFEKKSRFCRALVFDLPDFLSFIWGSILGSPIFHSFLCLLRSLMDSWFLLGFSLGGETLVVWRRYFFFIFSVDGFVLFLC